jgi:prophage regulatory protein
MSKQEQLLTEGFVRLDGVLRVYEVFRSHWYEGVKSGHYPQPTKLSSRISAWKVRDIRALIIEEK